MVERGGLENRCALAGTVGSNPTLSAILFSNVLISFNTLNGKVVFGVRNPVSGQ